MPLFEEYLELYPGNEILESILLDIYRSYAGALINAIEFLQVKSWCELDQRIISKLS